MEATFQVFFQALLAAFGFILVYLFNKVTQDLSKMTSSIEQLNIKIAVICERIESHDSRIKNIEGKITSWNS